jgi:hypothetical protein
MYFDQIRLVGTRYVKGNWGFPFVASFLVLLLAAAILLTAKTIATSLKTQQHVHILL